MMNEQSKVIWNATGLRLKAGRWRGIGCSNTTTRDPQERRQPTIEQTRGTTQSERKRLKRVWGEQVDRSTQRDASGDRQPEPMMN